MKSFLDYIGYRVFEYFESKDKALAKIRTINFIALLQGSFLVPIFMVIKFISQYDSTQIIENQNWKYYFGIPVAIILMTLNTYYFRKRLNTDGIKFLRARYHQKKHSFSVWWIFLAPIFFTFILPMVIASLNGTLHFPFFEERK